MTMADRIPLSRDRIILAAVAIVDEHGLEALSMRKLGAALGVEAMSLYNHVANKDDVLDGVLDHVLREVPLPDPTLAWDDQLWVLGRGFRDAGLAHPGVLPMFGARAIRTIEGHAPLEAAFGILRDAGLDRDSALDAFLSMSSFVLGFVLIDMGGMRQVADGRALAPSELAELAADSHPRLVELGEALGNGDTTREFERGFTMLLDGLRRLIEQQPTA
ncbi:MAG: TetR/AcrR family transcriptional regulator [Acidimicrobiales bacterium]